MEYSAKSQNIMNENPTKSPKAPPNSDTNDSHGYIITSVLLLTFLLASTITRIDEFVEYLKQTICGNLVLNFFFLYFRKLSTGGAEYFVYLHGTLHLVLLTTSSMSNTAISLLIFSYSLHF